VTAFVTPPTSKISNVYAYVTDVTDVTAPNPLNGKRPELDAYPKCLVFLFSVCTSLFASRIRVSSRPIRGQHPLRAEIPQLQRRLADPKQSERLIA
jgi:hypothetical protein